MAALRDGAVAALELGVGEAAAGADGVVTVHPAVDGDAGGGLAGQAVAAKVVNELKKRGELNFAGHAFLEITDQANADAAIVHLLGADVAAVDLAGPAWAHLNLAVTGVAAVADDKVVGEAVFHAAAAVGGAVGLGVARLDAAVVNDEMGPAAGFDGQVAAGGEHGGKGGRLFGDGG